MKRFGPKARCHYPKTKRRLKLFDRYNPRYRMTLTFSEPYNSKIESLLQHWRCIISAE